MVGADTLLPHYSTPVNSRSPLSPLSVPISISPIITRPSRVAGLSRLPHTVTEEEVIQKHLLSWGSSEQILHVVTLAISMRIESGRRGFPGSRTTARRRGFERFRSALLPPSMEPFLAAVCRRRRRRRCRYCDIAGSTKIAR